MSRQLRARTHLQGDVRRLLVEALRAHRRPVALASLTAPGDVTDAAAWNRSLSARWRALNGRLRVEMWRRHGVPPPRCLAWVPQRQRRGLDHLHLIWMCSAPDHRQRITLWVALYRELAPGYGWGFVDDPLRLRHPKTRDGRPDRSRSRRDMVFGDPATAGAYVGNYLSGGQLERFLDAEDRGIRPYWISPVLMRRSGWNLARCRMVRAGWCIARGQWTRYRWGMPDLPSWWHDPSHRAWVSAVIGWDGVHGSLAPEG